MSIPSPSAALDAATAVGEGVDLVAPGSRAVAPVDIAQPAPVDPTDERLLAQFLKGDTGALGSLAQRHERQLLGLAMGLLNGRRDLAMDAVQDTWLRVIKYGKSFRSGSTVKTWLYRILVNTCKDARTRSFKFDSKSTRVGTGSSLPVEDAPTQSPSHDTHSQSHIRAAIESLPGDHRLLVLLCYHNGLTHPQAAEVLSIPVGTLKSRLHTALNALREHLQESPERKLRESAPQAPRRESTP
jgi:RNA polymerase sigma-70 factor (ECF subfamily)